MYHFLVFEVVSFDICIWIQGDLCLYKDYMQPFYVLFYCMNFIEDIIL